YAFIALPGGFGTMDELFEVATLVQTGKVQQYPMALMGKAYWEPMLGFLRERMVTEKTIDPGDYDRILVSDDPDLVVSSLTEVAMARFGLSYGPQARRWWVFGEWGEVAFDLLTYSCQHVAAMLLTHSSDHEPGGCHARRNDRAFPLPDRAPVGLHHGAGKAEAVDEGPAFQRDDQRRQDGGRLDLPHGHPGG